MSITLSLEKIKEWEKEQNFDKEENDLALLESSYSDGTFPILSGDVKQAYASHLCQTWEIASDSFRQSLLQFLRIILRDKENSDLDCFLPVFNVLLQLVALTNDKETDVSAPTKLMLEADKCLVNLLFNSSKARELFQNTPFSQLLSRINTIENVYGGVETLYQFEYLNAWSNNEIEELLLYDLKIAFIATALIRKLQKECIEDTDKTMLFVNMVKYSLDKIISQNINKEALFTTMAWKYTNESLKTLLNLYHNATIFDLDTAQKCTAICGEIVQNTILDMETKQNAVNLLAVLPSTLPNLCPKIDSKTSSKKSSTALEDYDLGFVDALLKTFEEQIDNYEKEQSFIIEFLGTFLTVLNHLCTEHKAGRRFCRFKIIPPLKAQQVERPPEGKFEP